jgi:O-succinylbenzoic acid--CoA ligase
MQTAAQALLDALAARGDAPALRMPGYVVTAAELLDDVRRVQAELEALPFSLPPGSVLGIRGLDPRARIAAPLAAWALGHSTYFLSAREPDTRVPALLAEAGVRAWIEESDAKGVHWAEGPGHLTLEEGPHTLLRTSGSSGTPKLAVHGLAQHLESARSAARYFALGSEDCWLLTLPTWHVGGLAIVLRALVSGAQLGIPAFDAPLERALESLRPTHLSLVATQLQRLLAAPAARAHLTACRGLLLGGGPIPLALRAQALGAQLPMHTSYGSTETSGLIAVSGDPEVLGQADTAGPLLPGRRVRIDAAGQIHVAGPTVFRGYLEGGVLLDARDAEGWYATGDLGALDGNGVLHIRGRADRMFISGGENIQPEEIEAALLGLPMVEAAAVVPRPDREFGFRPVAFVRLEAGATSADVEAALRACLPGYKIPAAFAPMPPLAPGALKVDLQDLADRAREMRPPGLN